MRASSAASLASQACWAALADGGRQQGGRENGHKSLFHHACLLFFRGRPVARGKVMCNARRCAAGRSDRPVRHGTPEFSPISAPPARATDSLDRPVVFPL
jgi:hypothetical protein